MSWYENKFKRGKGHNLWPLLPKERGVICCAPWPGPGLGSTYFLLKGC